MRHLILAIAAAVLCAHTPAATQAPTPGPEHKRMEYFAGTWTFSGEMAATPMGPAGKVNFKETCEMMPGGLTMVCRSEGTNPAGPTRAIAIMGYDWEKKAYTYTAAESHAPIVHAMGRTDGPSWIWTTEMNMMTVRVTVKEGGAKAYDFVMEMSMSGGPFQKVMSGTATRVTS